MRTRAQCQPRRAIVGKFVSRACFLASRIWELRGPSVRHSWALCQPRRRGPEGASLLVVGARVLSEEKPLLALQREQRDSPAARRVSFAIPNPEQLLRSFRQR